MSKKLLNKVKTWALVAMILGNVLQGWFRGGPCEALQVAMNAVGVEVLSFDSVEAVETGPPLASKLVVELSDGQTVKILENGGVLVQ